MNCGFSGEFLAIHGDAMVVWRSFSTKASWELFHDCAVYHRRQRRNSSKLLTVALAITYLFQRNQRYAFSIRLVPAHQSLGAALTLPRSVGLFSAVLTTLGCQWRGQPAVACDRYCRAVRQQQLAAKKPMGSR
jgi:hypothetical protein